MTNRDYHPEQGSELRRRADAVARENAARSAEKHAPLSPEEVGQTLYGGCKKVCVNGH
jgi:hypothetical protein